MVIQLFNECNSGDVYRIFVVCDFACEIDIYDLDRVCNDFF